jgi:hypothetical protein
MIEYLGWAATAVFVGSYFFRDASLRRVQMIGASMWIVYGLSIRAIPVAVANLLVLLAAMWTGRRSRPSSISSATKPTGAPWSTRTTLTRILTAKTSWSAHPVTQAAKMRVVDPATGREATITRAVSVD